MKVPPLSYSNILCRPAPSEGPGVAQSVGSRASRYPARSPHDSPARMSPAATEEEARHGSGGARRVVGWNIFTELKYFHWTEIFPLTSGPGEVELVQRHRAVENVASGQTKHRLQVGRGQNLLPHDAGLEPGGVPGHSQDHGQRFIRSSLLISWLSLCL